MLKLLKQKNRLKPLKQCSRRQTNPVFRRNTFSKLKPNDILAIKAKSGDKLAECELVDKNIGLIIKVTKGYSRRGVDFEELIQAGRIGMLRAIKTYNSNESSFNTYAFYWIKRAIGRELDNNRRTIRLPVYVLERVSKIIKSKKELTERFGKEPTIKELSKAVNSSEERVRYLLELDKELIPLDKERTFEGEVLPHEKIAGESDVDLAKFEKLSRRSGLFSIISKLPKRLKKVIILRHGFDMREPSMRTLEEVGEILGVTRERVRQIEEKAIQVLKRKARSVPVLME